MKLAASFLLSEVIKGSSSLLGDLKLLGETWRCRWTWSYWTYWSLNLTIDKLTWAQKFDLQELPFSYSLLRSFKAVYWWLHGTISSKSMCRYWMCDISGGSATIMICFHLEDGTQNWLFTSFPLKWSCLRFNKFFFLFQSKHYFISHI